uniref:NADH-ubiquinone oxidoreductase chain 4 n=1 Tax=Syndesmis echinorum TaxID=2019369 RepID=A0A7G5XUL1_9PLAT|nr:NADH dehydrogenase subunit 4 [Syndesmis echinorum]QNA49646.1 NADH dehydrogenase subunit 4 [Syndesmis echinorum]
MWSLFSYVFLVGLFSNHLYFPVLLFFLFNAYESILSYSFYCSHLSFWLILITLYVGASLKFLGFASSNLSEGLFMLSLNCLVLYFLSNSGVLFYIFFELSVVPLFFIVYYNGYTPERLGAIYYLLVYGLIGGIPLLAAIVMSVGGVTWGSWVYLSSFTLFMELDSLYLVGLGFMLAFLIKMSAVGFHLWLPKVHVEAPTSGSILLAAILLKLGLYGFVVFNVSLSWWNSLFCLVAGFFIIFTLLVNCLCYVMPDSKVFIAYNSVAHMSLIILLCFFLSSGSEEAVIAVGVAHAFVSSSLFCLVGSWGDKSGSRSLFLFKSLFFLSSIVCVVFCVSIFFNCSTPPSFNFQGELLLVAGLMYYLGGLVSPLVVLNVFLSGLLSLYFYVTLVHGKLNLGGVSTLELNKSIAVFLNCVWGGALLYFSVF